MLEDVSSPESVVRSIKVTAFRSQAAWFKKSKNKIKKKLSPTQLVSRKIIRQTGVLKSNVYTVLRHVILICEINLAQEQPKK